MKHAFQTHASKVATISVVALFAAFALSRPSLTTGLGEERAVSRSGTEAQKGHSVQAAENLPQPSAQTNKKAAVTQTHLHGIDVSHYQGRIDWSKVAASGVRFTYMKATAGHTYVDARFANNRLDAASAGLFAGAYHFFIPNRDPLRQAKHYLQTVHVADGMLPPVLDLEKNMQATDGKTLADKALIWLQHVEEATGCRPIVYANRTFWEDHLGVKLSGYPLWLAEYSKTAVLPKGAKAWTFWQHSQTGQVDGIEGHVDLNLYAGTEDSLRALLCNSKVGQ